MKNVDILEQDLRAVENIASKYNLDTDEFARNLLRTTANRRDSNRIQIRLSDAERNIIENKAGDLGASTYCRMVSLNAKVNISIKKMKEVFKEEIEKSKGRAVENRNPKLNIRFKTNKEIDLIEEKAALLSLDASEYIRFTALNAIVSVESLIEK